MLVGQIGAVVCPGQTVPEGVSLQQQVLCIPGCKASMQSNFTLYSLASQGLSLNRKPEKQFGLYKWQLLILVQLAAITSQPAE